jgi:hypothetical protein
MPGNAIAIALQAVDTARDTTLCGLSPGPMSVSSMTLGFQRHLRRRSLGVHEYMHL